MEVVLNADLALFNRFFILHTHLSEKELDIAGGSFANYLIWLSLAR